MIVKVLKTAIADADGQEADLEDLYVSEARVDGAGVRIGTKHFIERTRAEPIRSAKKRATFMLRSQRHN